MKKLFIFALLFLIPTYSYSASYIDKQLKESKKNVKYDTVNKRLKREDYTKSFANISNLEEIKDPKLIKLIDVTPKSDDKFQTKISEDF